MKKPELNEFTIIVCKDYKDAAKFQEVAKEHNLYENIKTDDKYHDAYINIYDHTYNFIIKNKTLYICNIRVYMDDEKYKIISAREIFDYYSENNKISIKEKYPILYSISKDISIILLVILGIFWICTGLGLGLLTTKLYFLGIIFLLFDIFLIATPIYWGISYLMEKLFILRWIKQMKSKYYFLDFKYEYSRFGDFWYLTSYPDRLIHKNIDSLIDKQNFEKAFNKKFSAKISVY